MSTSDRQAVMTMAAVPSHHERLREYAAPRRARSPKMTAKTLAMTVLVMLVVGCSSADAAREQRVRITVTDRGFEPATVTVPSGRPVTLLVTRRTERTCATAFVLKRALRQKFRVARVGHALADPEQQAHQQQFREARRKAGHHHR